MAGTGKGHLRPAGEAALTVEDLVVEFPTRGGQVVHAVSGISFDVLPGETLGILGESGCGKSSAGRAVLQLPAPTSGSVRLGDVELTALSGKALRDKRSGLQMIFQDPVSSLNPRRRVRELVQEGPQIRGQRPDPARVDEVLRAVGLDPDVVGDRRPHELSGGQCQRVCIARALMLDPDIVICDEPVSSLDVSVQAQILNLLESTKERYSLSLVFIAHDLAVVKSISDRIMVMYLGKVCEVIPSGDLAARARHPYTRLLLESVPHPPARDGAPADEGVPDAPAAVEAAQSVDAGARAELPSPLDPPSGCRFRTRCPLATERCATEEPQLRPAADGHHVACHHADLS